MHIHFIRVRAHGIQRCERTHTHTSDRNWKSYVRRSAAVRAAHRLSIGCARSLCPVRRPARSHRATLFPLARATTLECILCFAVCFVRSFVTFQHVQCTLTHTGPLALARSLVLVHVNGHAHSDSRASERCWHWPMYWCVLHVRFGSVSCVAMNKNENNTEEKEKNPIVNKGNARDNDDQRVREHRVCVCVLGFSLLRSKRVCVRVRVIHRMASIAHAELLASGDCCRCAATTLSCASNTKFI